MSSCIMNSLKTQPIWVLVLFTIGSIYVSKCFIYSLYWLYVNFLRPAKNLKKYGSWALVTAPTDGIGKAFAFELARKGLNLVLVGRNPDKLKDVSDSIRSKYAKTLIKNIVVDFSGDLDDEGVKRIIEAIEGLDVGILINNVGISYPYARYFHEVDEKLITNLIKINVEGTTKVTHAVLPGMLKRNKGAIVNIGSAAGNIFPCPLYSVYAATKSYIDRFSRCLNDEYKKSGIDVQCQVPVYVATKMASIRNSSFFVPSSDDYARAGLRSIGYEPRCTPYWTHSLYWNLIDSFPESVIGEWRLRTGLKIRERGQLKDSMKKKL